MEPILQLAITVPPAGSRDRLGALHRQLRSAIVSGRLVPGTRLPPSRVLAQSVGVARNTVTAAYDLLLSEGYVTARKGSGTFVATTLPRVRARARRPAPQPGAPDPRLPAAWRDVQPPSGMRERPPVEFDFTPGLSDTRKLPFDTWRRLSGRATRDLARGPVCYEGPQGRRALREAIAGHVSFTRAVSCRAEDVIVTSGAQQAFDVLARVLVVPGRTTVAVEDPGYPPLRATLATAGAAVVPVPVDGDGVAVDALPHNAKIVCVTPSHQFPTGAAMSMARRSALLEFARENGAVVIEDDYDGEFRHSGRPLDALQTLDREQCVFYVGTFSKSLFPDLRLGYIVAPPWAGQALLTAKQRTDWHCPAIAQETLAAFIREGHLARHVRKMRLVYRERRNLLLDALAAHCGAWIKPLPSDAGLHIAGETMPGFPVDRLVRDAAGAGIRIQSLGRFAVARSAPEGLVFGFGAIEEARIDAAVRRLAQVAAGLLP